MKGEEFCSFSIVPESTFQFGGRHSHRPPSMDDSVADQQNRDTGRKSRRLDGSKTEQIWPLALEEALLEGMQR